tara:strand:+ start:1180 stop:3078 length:1899 start_codon:yes stop_codon:yes gene_type:complete
MATKGGGSLLGSADSTLVGMSYRQAMANVTPDLKQVYKDEVLNQAMFEKGVQDHFDALHSDYNALGDELKEATTVMNANLLAGTNPDDTSAELYNNELSKLKQQLKNTPKDKKGDLERTKIRAKLVRLKNSTDEWGQTITTLGTMIENDQGDFQATGEDLPFLTSIIKGEATKKIDDDGIFYYSMQRDGKEVTMTLPELKEAVVLKDPKHQGNFNKISPGFNVFGKQKGTKWENKRQEAVNAYEDIFTTRHSFATTINHKQGGMDHSFIEGLTGKGGKETGEIIYKTLMEMGTKENFYNGYDADKDGDVDEDDFLDPTNGKALINSLTNIKDRDNFNFQVAKKVAAEFYADGLAAKEFEDGVAMRPKDPITKTPVEGAEAPLFLSNQWYPLGTQGGSVTGGQINGWINDIKTGSSFDFDGNGFDFVDGGWYANYNDGLGEEEKSTPNSDNYIGDAETLIASAFGAGGGDERFNNITTEKIKIIDHKTGKVKDKEAILDNLVDKDLGISVKNMSDNENTMVITLNKLLPAMNTTEENYNFQKAKGGRDGQGFNLSGNKIGLYKGNGKIVKYPYDYKVKKLRNKHVIFETAGETVNDRENQFIKLIDILDELKIKDIMSKGGGNIDTSKYPTED